MIWIVAAFELAFLVTVVAMLVNLGRMRRLADLPLPDRAEWPTVSVVIPARNEGTHLGPAMQRRMATDYPGLEAILVDDRSEDDTGAIADRLAAADPRIRVIDNTGLPDGWLGKVHALDLGARGATGEWILFSDGDVEVAPGTLRRSVAFCEAQGFDLLVAIPMPDPAGPWVGGLHAIMARLLFGAAFVGAIEGPRRDWIVGVGAYTLVRREALERSAGFAAFRLDVADDLRLAQVVKRAGGPVHPGQRGRTRGGRRLLPHGARLFRGHREEQLVGSLPASGSSRASASRRSSSPWSSRRSPSPWWRRPRRCVSSVARSSPLPSAPRPTRSRGATVARSRASSTRWARCSSPTALPGARSSGGGAGA